LLSYIVISLRHRVDTWVAPRWGGLINNTKGNSSTCVSELGCSGPSATLACTGLASFAHNMTVAAVNATDGASWATSLFIPWGIWAPQFQPAAAASSKSGDGAGAVATRAAAATGASLEPWRLWRLNFYRYDYPDGPNAAFDNYELSAWSPTHSPSFHEPSRFGVAVLV